MRGSRLLRLVDGLLLALAGAVAATVVLAWAARLPHPYDLEWMEGGMLAHAWRLRHGLPLYPEPGPDFVPFVYPPGHPAVLAALGAVAELGHPLGRAVAIAGTLAAAAALAAGVARRGGSPTVGLGAAGLFLGTWTASGTFFDLVRPDALSLGLLAWALVLGLERRAVVASGLFLAAAFACKHNAAAFGLPMLVGIVARDGWRRGALFAAASAGPAGLLTLAVQVGSEGRFLRYIVGVPASHPVRADRAWPGTPGELADALPLVLAVAGGGLLWLAGRRRLLPARGIALSAAAGAVLCVAALVLAPWPQGVTRPGAWELGLGGAALGAGLGFAVASLAVRRTALPWHWIYGGGVAVTALVTAGLMRGHHGGYVNVLMPMHWVAVFGAGTVAARLRSVPLAGAAAGLLLAAQLALQLAEADTRGHLPTAADRAAGDRVVAMVRERCDGPVLSPLAAWLPVQAGGAPSVHLIALWDVQHRGGPFAADVERRIGEAVADHRWACVLQGARPLRFGIEEHYRPAGVLPVRGRELLPRTGWSARPSTLLVPR